MPPDRRIGLSQFASAALIDRKQSALASTLHLSEDSKLLATIQQLAGVQRTMNASRFIGRENAGSIVTPREHAG
jgi:hypothetical protein